MSRYKRPVVQLTSLLDLLFVMIFVLLLQSKTVPPKVEAKPTPEVAKKVEEKPKPQGKIAIAGTFHFYAPSGNPGLPEGKYAMEGTFNHDNGALQLGGVQWLNRPQGYDMVPLKGKINQAATLFTGNIEFPDCQTFTLRRTSTQGVSPISGTWEGSYVCSQGETGLTLTIL